MHAQTTAQLHSAINAANQPSKFPHTKNINHFKFLLSAHQFIKDNGLKPEQYNLERLPIAQGQWKLTWEKKGS